MKARTYAIVSGLVAVAAALRLYGIGWGLPEVFEEATPMREAWEMWGWGGRGFDPNPHFFNYPSLVIYLQFVAQAILLAALKAVGTIHSTIDVRMLYATDKTAFVLAARFVTAVVGTATVGALYALMRRVANPWAAAAGALFLALNATHIGLSQTVDVDVPLTFLCVAALWACVRLLDEPSRRRYLAAGILVGLAASAKYTGALLIVSVLTAHLLARRARRESPPAWSFAVGAVLAAIAAFVVTSPFVVLDAATFTRHFSVEQHHMNAGHFGLDDGASWRAYAGWLAGGGVVGWPFLALALAGLIYFAAFARRPWAIVLAAFVVPYALSVGSWAMRAERYLLPVIPVAAVFAVALAAELARSRAETGSRLRTRAAVWLAAIVIFAPLAAAFPRHLERLQTDPRTSAREWIEKNVAAGSFIVTEAYGPHLFGPYAVWQLDDDVRARVFAGHAERPYYAVQELPMYQVDPERSGVFYDHSVLSMADVVITTDAVRARYERDPSRFARQRSFYRTLEENYDKVAEFTPDGSAGRGVHVFRNRLHAAPFSMRDVGAPPPVQTGLPAAPGAQEQFYFYFGINYEAFNHYAAAYVCYETAFRYSVNQPFLFADVAMGMARCLDATGQRARALELLSRVEAAESDPRERSRVRRLRETMSGLR